MHLIAVSAIERRQARLWSTIAILVGVVMTSVVLPSDSAVGIFSAAAYGVGVTLAGAILIEARSGIRSLIRVDLLLLLALYGLTLLEFLFRQSAVEALLSPVTAANGTYAVLVAFAGLAIGRHFVPIRESLRPSSVAELRPSSMLFVFLVVTFFGYLHILLAVEFDISEAIRQMLLPRFYQSWSRGQYGDAAALLYEVGSLISLIPPIAGLIFARARQYSAAQKAVVVIVLAFTAFYSFSSGTRSTYVVYILTFTGSYFVAKQQLNLPHVLTFGTIMAALLFVGVILMLQFRTVGLGELSSTEESGSFYIDLDIINISRLTDKFPDAYDYLGLEIPMTALIRPVPRVLWPGKPTGLSVPIETALGAGEGLTVSCTYVGEAYMAGGLLAVLTISLLFGAAAEMWNRVGLSNNQFNQLVYVSGFLCAAITMRSMLAMTPLTLPTIALWILGKPWLSDTSIPASRSASDGEAAESRAHRGVMD
jgi:oligosaccharide repeat unit polymerase